MTSRRTVIFMMMLATCAAAGCASQGETEALADAEPEPVKVTCSGTAPVGTHMKRVVCRSQEVVDYTSERAQRALRQQSLRQALPTESGGR